MTYLDVGSNDGSRTDVEDVAGAQRGLVHQVGLLLSLKSWTGVICRTSIDTIVVLTDIASNVHQTIQTGRIEGNTHIRMNGFNGIDAIVQHEETAAHRSTLIGFCQIFQHGAGTTGNGKTRIVGVGHPVVPTDIGCRLQNVAIAIVILEREFQADRRAAGGINIDVVLYRMNTLTNLLADSLTRTVIVVPAVLLYRIGKVRLRIVRTLRGTLIVDKQEGSLLKEAIGIDHVQVVGLVGQLFTGDVVVAVKDVFCRLPSQVIAHHNNQLIVLPATGKSRHTASRGFGDCDVHDVGSVRFIARLGAGS